MAHRTRTKLEAAVCAEMERRGVPHGHRVLHYRVRMKSGKVARYEPAIIAHRGPILFLVEPFATLRGAVERTTRFLDQHSPEIVLAVVAPERIASKLPPESTTNSYEAGDATARSGSATRTHRRAPARRRRRRAGRFQAVLTSTSRHALPAV
jgi:hypothetical protein